jgi:hypothetical protein
VCREDWTIQVLHGIQPLCLITRFGEGIDHLLKIDEAAARLGTSPDWLYRNAGRFSFTVRLSPRQLRFSAKGIDLFIANRPNGHETV